MNAFTRELETKDSGDDVHAKANFRGWLYLVLIGLVVAMTIMSYVMFHFQKRNKAHSDRLNSGSQVNASGLENSYERAP